MDEIRFVGGPIIQRYQDKVEADRQLILQAEEAKRAEAAAAAEAAKKAAAAEQEKKQQQQQPASAAGAEDTEMKDANAMAAPGAAADGPGGDASAAKPGDVAMDETK
jgi:heat shock 70kDa protein 4